MSSIDPQKFDQQIRQALDEAVENLRREAVSHLRDFSLSAELRQKLEASLLIEKSSDGQSLFLRSSLKEAADLEWGTLQHAPHPWLSQALQRVLPDLKQKIRAILQSAGRG